MGREIVFPLPPLTRICVFPVLEYFLADLNRKKKIIDMILGSSQNYLENWETHLKKMCREKES